MEDYKNNGLDISQIKQLLNHLDVNISGFDLQELFDRRGLKTDIRNNLYQIKTVRDFIYSEMKIELPRGVVVSFMNNKGGVGKTLNTFIQASNLHSMGYNVLVIDTDGQKNFSGLVSQDWSELEPNIYNCLEEGLPLNKALVEITEGYFYARGTRKIDLYKRHCYQDNLNELNRMMSEVNELKEYFDFIFIDTSPTLDDFNVGVIAHSDIIITPVGLDTQAIHGAKELFSEIRTVCEEFDQNPYEKIRIVMNQADNNKIQKQVKEQAIITYEPVMYSEDLIIPKAARLAEATNYSAPLWAFKDLKHKAVNASYRLSKYILKHAQEIIMREELPGLPLAENEFRNQDLGENHGTKNN